MRRPHALIVGAGPAGTAAAIGLAQAGLAPIVIERDRETGDALCGGFLSWATLARLERLGIPAERIGGQPIERLALFAGGRSAKASLPHAAMAVSRRRLDTLLQARAEAAGAGIERGVAARAYEEGRVRLSDGTDLVATRTLLATGKHELRGAARPSVDDDPAVGLRWRLAPTPSLRRLLGGTIEMHLFAQGYAGLVLQEEDANLCMAVRQSRLREQGGDPNRLLAALAGECPWLADRLAAAAGIGKAQAVARVPYGFRARLSPDGLYRMGDQAGVIPSLAGEGIAIALASGVAAAEAIAQSRSADRFQRSLARRLAAPIGIAYGIWRAAETLEGAGLLVRSVGAAPALARWAARLTRA